MSFLNRPFVLESWGGLSALLGIHGSASPHEPALVRTGVIGRGHAGKTALFRTMSKGPLTDFLPSGLQIDLEGPLDLTEVIQETSRTIEDLRVRGLAQTLDPSDIRYYLLEGERKRVLFQTKEVVGQVLTHTTRKSPPDQMVRYWRYIDDLAEAHVLWTAVPCPPIHATAEDHDRYGNDLRITASYLREALRYRSTRRPCSVAVLLTKIDSLFPSAVEARRQLTAETLKGALGPLVRTVTASTKISDAAIIPVSAFGFGNAVQKTDDMGVIERPEHSTAESGELEWILKTGRNPEPYNFAALLVWTLLHGLLNQEFGRKSGVESSLTAVCRLLAEDLEQVTGWYVPIKGRLAAATAGAR